MVKYETMSENSDAKGKNSYYNNILIIILIVVGGNGGAHPAEQAAGMRAASSPHLLDVFIADICQHITLYTAGGFRRSRLARWLQRASSCEGTWNRTSGAARRAAASGCSLSARSNAPNSRSFPCCGSTPKRWWSATTTAFCSVPLDGGAYERCGAGGVRCVSRLRG